MLRSFGCTKLGRTDEEGVKQLYRGIKGWGRECSIGPKDLQRRLGITPEDFDERKNILQEMELIGTVQGGGIFRHERGDHNEVSYYRALIRELDQHWAEQPGREYHLRQRFLRVLDTHHGGRRMDGFWARPDITLLGGKVLPYLPGKFLDVVTFEVKLGMPVQGLYEALAHRRRANYAYVLYIWLDHWEPPGLMDQATVVAEATRQGIGVILARQEDDFATWNELVSPIRHSPDPQQLHDFLETQCDRNGCLEELSDWLQLQPFNQPEVTKGDLDRLPLTTEQLDIARKVWDTVVGSDDSFGPTAFKNFGGSRELTHVRDVMKTAGLIDVTQGGGIKRKDELS